MAEENTTTDLEPALYLIPVTLTDGGVPSAVMPARNLEIAGEIRHFIVENVRTARRFLKRCDPSTDISALTFSVLNKDTPAGDVDAMLAPILRGEPVGVMSEAGCPAVADPGALAVAAAHRQGLRVVPLVGPSSILLALMGSGFNGQSFSFAGYLPIDEGARRERLRSFERRIRQEDQTQIFIETPYRNNRLIASLAKSLPASLRLCVASDLTGPRQRIDVRTLGEWARAKYDYDKIPTIFLLYR
ncbi:MAG: SAM-dependent methyltransferase [Clostridium sp.]|nr:SAM-dependent methyltransferase [Clostridium sp.]